MPEPPITGLYELERPLPREEVVEGLAAMPGRLAAVVRGARSEALLRRPSPGEWPPFQVVCHFRDIALVYGTRFRWIVFNDDPFLPDYDENRWVAECRDTPADLPAMLGEIAASRAAVCRMLERLAEHEWQRAGRHEVLGPVVLEPYVRHQLAHEEMHLAQVAAALGRVKSGE